MRRGIIWSSCCVIWRTISVPLAVCCPNSPNPADWKDTQALHEALFAAYDGNWGLARESLRSALAEVADSLPTNTRDDWYRASAVIVHLGFGPQLLEFLVEQGADVRLMPWFEAVRAHVVGDERHLGNIPAEARAAAAEIYAAIDSLETPAATKDLVENWLKHQELLVRQQVGMVGLQLESRLLAQSEDFRFGHLDRFGRSFGKIAFQKSMYFSTSSNGFSFVGSIPALRNGQSMPGNDVSEGCAAWGLALPNTSKNRSAAGRWPSDCRTKPAAVNSCFTVSGSICRR